MLSCVYHPIHPMRVVEEHDAESLIKTGLWFDCPGKAKRYREQVEQDIKKEPKVIQKKAKNKNLNNKEIN